MKSLWDAAARAELRDRLGRLTPDARRQWGSMTAHQMVAHLVDSLRMAHGELPVASKNLPIRYTPLKQLIIYCLPFPKGAPTAPELLGRAAQDWPGECASLLTLMDLLAARDRSRPLPDHPAFGRLSERAWGVLVYRHMDHHFRQFGI